MKHRVITAYWFFFPVTLDLTSDTGTIDHDRWQYVYFNWFLQFITRLGVSVIRKTPTGFLYAFPTLHVYDKTLTMDEFREVQHIIERNINL